MSYIVPFLTGILLSILFFLTCLGLGKIVHSYIFRNSKVSMATGFFSGLILLIFYLQLWHLSMPITLYSSILPLTAGIWGLSKMRCLNIFRFNFEQLGVIFLFVLFSVFYIIQSFYDKFSFDSLTYYIHTVMWYKAEPIIPGHSNLFVYFGLNQSWFLLSALLDSTPNAFRGIYMTNAVLLASASFLYSLRAIAAYRSMQYGTMALYLLGLLFFLKTIPNQINTPASDIPVLVITFEVLSNLSGFIFKGRISAYRLTYILSLCALGVSIKLSMIGVSVGVVLFALLNQKHSQIFREYYRVIIFASCIFLVYVLRGIIISGYPFFPFAGIHFPVDWLSDYHFVYSLSDYIKKFAFTRYHVYNYPDFHIMDWIGHWFRHTLKVQIVLYFLAGILSLLTYFIVYKQKLRILVFYLLVPFIALLFWFFTAPDPRFIAGVFIGIGSLGFSVWSTLLKRHNQFLFFAPLIVMAYFLNRDWNPKARYPDTTCVKNVLPGGLEVYTPGGLEVYTPGNEDINNWRTAGCPLPCAVILDERLRLRGTTYREGFKLEAIQKHNK